MWGSSPHPHPIRETLRYLRKHPASLTRNKLRIQLDRRPETYRTPGEPRAASLMAHLLTMRWLSSDFTIRSINLSATYRQSINLSRHSSASAAELSTGYVVEQPATIQPQPASMITELFLLLMVVVSAAKDTTMDMGMDKRPYIGGLCSHGAFVKDQTHPPACANSRKHFRCGYSGVEQ
jgi:hypothetical protein